ncbi:MAG: hypothetical protein NT049_18305 [Planctomycetota bacterium]|nr:hypothetical protein [Planctomycetota bacterium]
MTQLAGTETGGRAAADSQQGLAAYQARASALYKVREALEAADSWDAFQANLKQRGMPEARARQIVDVPVPMDLHLHSTHSDGQIPAQKLAWLARVIGLRYIALADHDSISGTRALYGEAMLLGLAAMPAVELSTGLAGLEILLYFPDAGRFFDFLTSQRGRRFTKYLAEKQQAVHEATLKVLVSVNRWLKRQGIPTERHITVEELDAWFGGQQPYYPGTLAVLGLKRLDEKQRKALKIHDPRMFNTKVVTPALRRLADAPADPPHVSRATDALRRQLTSIRQSRSGAIAILSHPKELVTKGKMSLGKVAQTIEYLVEKAGLDGIEIGCARDTPSDVQVWREIVEDINGKIACGKLSAPGPLLVSSYTSDFHVLAPGAATGEITLGFGLMDERPEYRRGNLRPQTSPEELLEAMRHRAAMRCKE